MRVVVCPDAIGPLDAAAATRILATGWPGQDLLLRPSAEAGAGFVSAVAAQWGVEPRHEVVHDRLVTMASSDGRLAVAVPGDRGSADWAQASSRALGTVIRVLLPRHRPRQLWLDLVSDDVHDGGAGLRAAIEDELAGPELAGLELIGVVPEAERTRMLLGLRGITSMRGREAGEDPARLLQIDARLAELASSWGVGDQPGAGACGGTGLAILALGGRLATGPELTLAGIAAPVDLVVTGCTRYDFASRGGGVVAAAARLAAELLCPCVVLAGDVLIGGREMRTMGVEAAYGLEVGAGEVTAAALGALAARVGRSWRW